MRSKLKTLILILALCFACLVSYKTYGVYSEIEWQTGLGIGLPANTSAIDANGSLFFSGFIWDEDDASTVSFSDLYMASGPALSSVTVSTSENITFTVVSSTELDYSVAANGTQVFSGIDKPENVTVDGVLYSEGHHWNFSGNTLTVSGAVSDVAIAFTVSGLTADDAVGIAIAFSVLILAVCVALIYSHRRKYEKERG